MPKFRLSRRAVLRGAGGIAIGLPWLEIMGRSRRASAATTPALRFMTVYQPGGSVIQGAAAPTPNRWRPTGTETAPVLSPILAPLQPILSKLLIVDGLDLQSAVGEQHQAGIIAWLTGIQQVNAQMFPMPGGPSIDQVLADTLSKGKALKSIQMAVRWATGKSHGLLSPINAANYENTAGHNPIPPQLDPVQVWGNLFGGINAGQGSDAALRIQRKKSILDFVDKRYSALEAKLGAADRSKIDEHLTKIREIENSLTAMTGAGTSRCVVPKQPVDMATTMPNQIDVSGYNPRSGLNSADNGSIVDNSTDTEIPMVGKLMMDMAVMAFACDLTGVISFQWSDTEAKHTFPWLSLANHHLYYQHDGGFQPVQCEQIATWYSQMHLYLLQAMDKVDMGGHTLLDESVVFFGTEIADPPSHKKVGMPFLLAGKGGGLRTGRWVRYDQLTGTAKSHNNLLVSIFNLFGDTRTTFGDPAFCTGPLANLV
jgi:Protein of unknown function (DUF1552)